MRFEDLAPDTKELLRHKAVSVKAIGLQRGSDRFTREQDQRCHDHIPGIREWRLNLTRLSQVCNLFFVAYLDKIYVYEPSHPDQNLPEKPSLILSPPKTPSARYGYLDQECPHSINHLFVDFLGDLEIALVACDDGDIIGYYVNEIKAGIDRRLDPKGPKTILGEEVQPFFMHSVRMSAWGLSVHSEARRIAASSNTHEVTVISFGLTDYEFKESVRSSDHQFMMTGFHNNLPSVAFCNTDDDPQGRVLISGEITGLIYLHDLGTLNRNEIMQIGFCRKIGPASIRCDCLDRNAYPHSIWCMAFIDRRAFRKIAGYVPDQLGDAQFEKYWNGSMMKQCVPKATHKYLLKRARAGYQAEGSITSSSSSDNDDEDEDEDIDEEELSSDILSTQPPSHWQAYFENITHPWHANEQPTSAPKRLTPPIYSSGKKFHLSRWASPTPDEAAKEEWNNIPCPLLITSKTDLNLLQPENEDGFVNPVITFEEPLNQAYEYGDVTGARPSFTQPAVNRMSLYHVITELGVLIVGSPNGRVAVYSLLRTDDWPARPDGIYIMRLDWLLPFSSQEEEGLRPERKLLGLAASPMQGQLGPPRLEIRRTWRLMLYYADHSILGYEISLPD